jgi:hypothetical protein
MVMPLKFKKDDYDMTQIKAHFHVVAPLFLGGANLTLNRTSHHSHNPRYASLL